VPKRHNRAGGGVDVPPDTLRRFGRYVYAIGGNREAARRAGINVHRVRVLAYTLAGLTAAAAIIILDSRTGGVTTDIDGGQTVLYGVAAAVIGGTSLLGGRGKMVHALLAAWSSRRSTTAWACSASRRTSNT